MLFTDMHYVGETWVQHIIDTDTNTNIYPYWFLSDPDLLHKAETWIKNFPTTLSGRGLRQKILEPSKLHAGPLV